MTNQAAKRAIIIDRNESFRNALSSILEKRGYEVHAVADPAFCPIYLHHECSCSPGQICTNVIIIDINQPGMTGIEFIERQKRYNCKVNNIAVMSASWKDSDVEQLESIGSKILNKPFKMDELRNWLDDCEKQIQPDLKLSKLPKEI